ncbi:hypothetical protein H0264_14505 [Nocardia huaxiensis]|uniref:Uncharacterized protein n=1 Tax=Nocardia huaxiensis TaxID=2755382 RepID=A0A7D6ZKC9_9NOCA|nr:hypothetical protein [Nocardia huaxiensis]QLY33279.1 hypothetical protein H0264_14505 [Nocardia huaxiensis]
MSDNSSEVDQITGEVSRSAMRIAQVIGSWRLLHPNATTLSRSALREVNGVLAEDAREQRRAHVRHRVTVQHALRTYRWKLLTDSGIRTADTLETWFERQRLLTQSRERIEGFLHASPHLTATERQQVTTALSGIHRDPLQRPGPVFTRPAGIEALRERLSRMFSRAASALDRSEPIRPFGVSRDRAGQFRPQRRPDRWHHDMSVDPDAPIDLFPTDLAPDRANPVTVAQLTESVQSLQAENTRLRTRLANGGTDGSSAADNSAAMASWAEQARRLFHDRGYTWTEAADHLGLTRLQLDAVLTANPPTRAESGMSPQPGSVEQTTDSTENRSAPTGPTHEPDSFRVEVISHPNDTDTTTVTAVDRNRFGTPTEALEWAKQQLSHHGPYTAVTVHPQYTATDSFQMEVSRGPVYLFAGRTDIVQSQLHDDIRERTLERDPSDPPDSAVPEQDREAPQAAPSQDRDHGYEVTVGSADFVQKHPDMAHRIEVGTLADGYTWALDQLGDDSQGWPADADVIVRIRPTGTDAPLHELTGTRYAAIDEVAAWQEDHKYSPLAEIDRLRGELRAAQAEVGQLRTENTELVQKFAEHSPTSSAPPATPPTGPRLARPIFAGPVIPQPTFNGMDR